jgi:pyridoxal phosphate enzyme (YggS family)
MTMIADNLQWIHARMAQACRNAGRPHDSVALLAVSKTFGADAVVQAYVAGQTAFGENYIQEAVEKIAALGAWAAEHSAQVKEEPAQRAGDTEQSAFRPRLLAHSQLQWHCIGPIQSNKTRLVAEHFDWVHTVDRLKIAQRLSEQRPPHLAPLQVCIQVNVDGGPTKSGVAPDQALALAQAVAALPRLRVRGLMCIPEPAPDFVAACEVFARARALFDQMNRAGMGLDTLSMGMSADLEAAIASGSTMVRVGSAIFGART